MHCRTYILAGALSLAATAAAAQQLFTFAEPADPVAVQSASAAADDIGPNVAAPRNIEIDLDVLRSAPGRIVLPSWHGPGREILDLRHFEDRGEGNVLWSGSAPGTPWEDAIFTVHDGHLVGLYRGESGQRYQVDANGSRSSLTAVETPTGDWCHVVSTPPRLGGLASVSEPIVSDRAAAYADDRYRIDIAFLVTPAADRKFFRRYSRNRATWTQGLVDYSNMVFRNSELKTHLNVVAVENAPSSIMDTGSSLGGDHPSTPYDVLADRLIDARVQAVRRATGADLVHYLNWNQSEGNYCGAAWMYMGDMTIEDMARGGTAYTNTGCYGSRAYDTFIHEMGHTLGGNHNRQVNHYPESRAQASGYGLRNGYGVLVNPRVNGNWYRTLETARWSPSNPNPQLSEPRVDNRNTGAYTIMAYDPGANWIAIPRFSDGGLTPLRPNDYWGLVSEDPNTLWTLGHFYHHDNFEVFTKTSKDIARLSEYQWRYSRMPEQFKVRASDRGDGTLQLSFTWRDTSDDELSFVIHGHVWETPAHEAAVAASADDEGDDDCEGEDCDEGDDEGEGDEDCEGEDCDDDEGGGNEDCEGEDCGEGDYGYIGSMVLQLSVPADATQAQAVIEHLNETVFVFQISAVNHDGTTPSDYVKVTRSRSGGE